jgi:hypothetical protein
LPIACLFSANKEHDAATEMRNESSGVFKITKENVPAEANKKGVPGDGDKTIVLASIEQSNTIDSIANERKRRQ